MQMMIAVLPARYQDPLKLAGVVGILGHQKFPWLKVVLPDLAL